MEEQTVTTTEIGRNVQEAAKGSHEIAQGNASIASNARISVEGAKRTESVAKSLAATGTSIDTFVQLIEDTGRNATEAVPLLGFAEAGSGGYFDDAGFPVGKGWDEIAFPAVNDEHAYALEISGDSMLPAYRDGDVIIVSPAAPVRRGDRVVVRTKEGEVLAKELKRQLGIMRAQDLNHFLSQLHCQRVVLVITIFVVVNARHIFLDPFNGVCHLAPGQLFIGGPQ